MSEANFTKGPWRVSAGHPSRIYGWLRKDKEVIVAACGSVLNQEVANANLIACAPEMYKEIEKDIAWLAQMRAKFVFGSYEFKSICSRIETKQKLLAKARGENDV